MKVIHVNRHHLIAARKGAACAPPIAIRPTRSGKATYVTAADLIVDGKVIGKIGFHPTRPLNCGAVVYLELNDSVDVRPIAS